MNFLEQTHSSHLKDGNIVSMIVKGKLFKLLILFFQCMFSTEYNKTFSVNLIHHLAQKMGFCH